MAWYHHHVADLAAILALTKISSSYATVPEYYTPMRLAQHWTWAMRWTGQYKPSSRITSWRSTQCGSCFVLSIKEQIERDRKRKLRMEHLMTYHGGNEVLRLKLWSRRSLTPHMQSLAILLPDYLTLGIISTYLFRQAIIEFSLRLNRATIHFRHGWNCCPNIILFCLFSTAKFKHAFFL